MAHPAVQILATSREPLRVEGEQVHRLPPLESPPASTGLTAAAALGFPAVQLFVERAAANLGRVRARATRTPRSSPTICRKLDGVPLAIELAAARIDAFGVRGLAAHLDDRLQLLTGGRRPALPRHHSLRANLDWGHDLLREPERVVLRRVAIFAGGFTLGAAKAVAASAEIAAAGGRRVRREPGHEVADRGGRGWRGTALPPARDDAGLRAREALRERRARGGRSAATQNTCATWFGAAEVDRDMPSAADGWRGMAVRSMLPRRGGDRLSALGNASSGAPTVRAAH